MFGHTHPDLIKLQQVALEMKLMIEQPMPLIGSKNYKNFQTKHGVVFGESAFRSRISNDGRCHYLVIELDVGLYSRRVAYIGVRLGDDKLFVVFGEKPNDPRLVPDFSADTTVDVPDNGRPVEWVALKVLMFFAEA